MGIQDKAFTERRSQDGRQRFLQSLPEGPLTRGGNRGEEVCGGQGVSTSLVYIKEKLVSIFPILADKIFSVSWTDEDGDSITIDTDEEFILALTELPGPVYKLTATVRAAKKVEEPQEPGVGANMTHHGVTCDGCDKAPIVGFRYKCVVCDD